MSAKKSIERKISIISVNENETKFKYFLEDCTSKWYLLINYIN